METKLENGYLIVKIPANTKNPPPSQSGKSYNVVSTGGFTPTGLTVDGKPLKINVTAIIPAR